MRRDFPCRQCGRPKARTATDRCSACREYQRRHGVIRPFGQTLGNVQHGQRRPNATSPTYRSWTSMKHRCYTPGVVDYGRYGARGIQVCERWRKSFVNFFADMGERHRGTTLDRIDTNGHYEPTNCRWGTIAEQNANKRNLRLITLHGRTQCLAAWAMEQGVSESCLRYRLAIGCSMEETLVIYLAMNDEAWHSRHDQVLSRGP